MALLPVAQLSAGRADGVFFFSPRTSRRGSCPKSPVTAIMITVAMKTQTRESKEAETNAGVSALHQCPSCHMVIWHDPGSTEELLCPFCFATLPAWLTRIVPETITMNETNPTGKSPRRPMAAEHSDSSEPHGARSPFLIEFFMVQGAGFRCMAYRNGDGKWREAFNNEELPGAIRVLG